MVSMLAILMAVLVASPVVGRVAYLRGRRAGRAAFEAEELPYLVGRALHSAQDRARSEGFTVGYSEGKVDGERVGLGKREMAERGF